MGNSICGRKRPMDPIVAKIHAGNSLEACEDMWSRVVDQNRYEHIKDLCQDLDINNLVFEGGGTKGIAYCGAIKALQDLGLLQKVTRFAGTSAGSYIAMKLCLNMDVQKGVDDVLLGSLLNLQDSIYDSTQLRLPFNVMYKFGWHSGCKLLEHIRGVVREATGDPDTTFQQWYKKTNRELCVVVANLSTGTVEYCHPKTTPTMTIALAVKTSMSLPIFFQPSHIKYPDGAWMYCDGGLLDNYPVHAFDGWYLSTKVKDSFFHRFDEIDRPFAGAANPKTLGLLLYNAEETEFNEEIYSRRYVNELEGDRPDTKLARKRGQALTAKHKKKEEQANLIQSCTIFLKQLCESNLDNDDHISRQEFKKALEGMLSCEWTKKHLLNIFGEDFNVDQIEAVFEKSDLDKDEMLSFDECLHMLQNAGAPYRQLLQARSPSSIAGFHDFIQSIFSAMEYRVRSITEGRKDANRTIGIYTDYIGTTDFKMEMGDKVYAVKQGWKAVIVYLEDLLRNRQGLKYSESIMDYSHPNKV